MSEPHTVLIIDDDPDFLRAVGGLLTSAGYEVHTAHGGREGLDLAKRLRPHLILLDIMMADRTEGFFTLEQMRDVPELQKTPVIVVSSIYTAQPVFKVSPEAGWLPADLFLAKPVDPARLLEESARLIAARAAGDASSPIAGSTGR